MKKLIMTTLITLAFVIPVIAKTIHINHAYALEKSKGQIYKLRVYTDQWHDWYVVPTDKPWLFRGFESDDKIIVDKITDIATDN